MKKYACLLFLSSVLSGCLASLQPARTIPDNSYRFFAGSSVGIPISGPAASSPTVSTNFFENKTLDFGLRYGLGVDSDLGVRFSFPSYTLVSPTIYIDGKYELVDKEGFVWAIAAGPLYSYVGSGSNRAHFLALGAGFLFGYDFTREVGMYLGTHALIPILYSFQGTSLPKGKVSYAVSTGIRIGDTYGILFEGTYFNSNSANNFEVGGVFFIGDATSTSDSFETNRRAERYKDRRLNPNHSSMERRTRPIRNTSRVQKVKASDSMALLSQPTSGNWNIGERVCLFRQNESIACGTITKSDYTGAVLKYGVATEVITPGMDAASEVNDTRRRLAPSPEEKLEPDPEATDPGIPELP